MKRTTIYLEPELEVAIKLHALREDKTMTLVIRDALKVHLAENRPTLPPGAGEFASGHANTAEGSEQALADLRFGGD